MRRRIAVRSLVHYILSSICFCPSIPVFRILRMFRPQYMRRKSPGKMLNNSIPNYTIDEIIPVLILECQDYSFILFLFRTKCNNVFCYQKMCRLKMNQLLQISENHASFPPAFKNSVDQTDQTEVGEQKIAVKNVLRSSECRNKESG